ncbi:MAG: purine-nucleoside phosphorylase [Clostridia bacterium]|nr:purine-nucleoside phosphorylase [Clostridia bacterium]
MSKNYPTPHINAIPSDFANTVLMPGDPKRAEFIAKEFMSNSVLVNDVRGIQGYTGEYNGKRVSVMASGMGMPSIGIYSYELFNFFGVENIIRVGSAGAMQDNMKLGDLVFGMGASTDSNYIKSLDLPGSYAPIASYSLLKKAVDTAEAKGFCYHAGQIVSTDVFYSRADVNTRWAEMGVLAVEMEAAALYANAAKAGKKALAVLTVSDHVFTGESMSAEQRQTSFADMITLALEIA